MSNKSAGLLMYKFEFDKPYFFLVHPGGPFFAKKDEGYWGIPKGEPENDEADLPAAQREFEEETGMKPTGPYIELGMIKQKNGKQVFAWAFEGQWNEKDGITSNTIELHWPPKSGKFITIPEVDKGAWMDYQEASERMNQAQFELIDRLMKEIQ
jgi:predicted NUDIX family NTP pyrophosphohydrolase